MMFMQQNLSDAVCKWTNAEVRSAYKGNWEEIDEVEMKIIIRLNILIGFYKSKNNNILHLWSKEGGLFFNKVTCHQFSKILHFNNKNVRRTRSNDEVRPIRDVLGTHLLSVFTTWIYYISLVLYLFCYCSCLWIMYVFFPKAVPFTYVFFAFLCLPELNVPFFLSLKSNIVYHKHWYDHFYFSQNFYMNILKHKVERVAQWPTVKFCYTFLSVLLYFLKNNFLISELH